MSGQRYRIEDHLTELTLQEELTSLIDPLTEEDEEYANHFPPDDGE